MDGVTKVSGTCQLSGMKMEGKKEEEKTIMARGGNVQKGIGLFSIVVLMVRLKREGKENRS